MSRRSTRAKTTAVRISNSASIASTASTASTVIVPPIPAPAPAPEPIDVLIAPEPVTEPAYTRHEWLAKQVKDEQHVNTAYFVELNKLLRHYYDSTQLSNPVFVRAISEILDQLVAINHVYIRNPDYIRTYHEDFDFRFHDDRYSRAENRYDAGDMRYEYDYFAYMLYFLDLPEFHRLFNYLANLPDITRYRINHEKWAQRRRALPTKNKRARSPIPAAAPPAKQRRVEVNLVNDIETETEDENEYEDQDDDDNDDNNQSQFQYTPPPV